MRASSLVNRLLRATLDVVARRPAPPARPRARPVRPAAPARRAAHADSAAGSTYPGDHVGRFDPVYAPALDGAPDPGEIVWTWVPYEDDPRQGKDRPVLLVGRDGPWLLGLMLSSRDQDTRPSHPDQRWMDLGTGDWDARRRPSEVRLDRVVRVDPDAVRREGAVLDRVRFDAVARELRSTRSA